MINIANVGLPWWVSGNESTCQRWRHGFAPWVSKIPWRRKWQPILVFLPGKSHGQRSLAGYSPWGHKRVGHDLATKQQPNLHCCTIYRKIVRRVNTRILITRRGLPYGSDGKESACQCRRPQFIPGVRNLLFSFLFYFSLYFYCICLRRWMLA